LKSEILRKYFIPIVCSIWLSFPLTVNINFSLNDLQVGVGGYNTIYWKNSTLIEWLKDNSLEGSIYSNNTDYFYIIAGINSKMSSYKSSNITEFKNTIPEDVKNYLIWTEKSKKSEIYDITELTTLFDLQIVVAFSDGAIYQFI